jgi:hypothetical protein
MFVLFLHFLVTNTLQGLLCLALQSFKGLHILILLFVCLIQVFCGWFLLKERTIV